MIEGFLLGVITTCSFVAGGFFLKFWHRTRDLFFLAFGAAFLIEGFNRVCFLFVERPNEGRPAMYVVRLLAFLLIAAAIVWKNSRHAPGVGRRATRDRIP
jgi:uncharacterized membrane protein HdeD (DUF308 family)